MIIDDLRVNSIEYILDVRIGELEKFSENSDLVFGEK